MNLKFEIRKYTKYKNRSSSDDIINRGEGYRST